MDPRHTLAFELARAGSFEEWALLLAQAAERDFKVLCVNICPLFAGANPETESVTLHQLNSPEVSRAHMLEALPVSDAELGSVLDVCSQHRSIDGNEVIGWSNLQRTQTYNDFWRRDHVERQLLTVLGAPEAPLGFLAVCRRFEERAFSPDDLRSFDQLARLAEPSLRPLAEARGGWLGSDALLHALRVALPNPCGVLDSLGRVLWVNHAAEHWFNVRCTKTAEGRVVGGCRPALGRWSEAVQKAATDPPLPEAWEADGITVRRVDRPKSSPVWFVTASGRPRALLKSLSARELEVAELASRGYSTLNIALKLHLSEGTVRNHLKRIYAKLSVSTRVELARLLWSQ